MLEWEDIPHNQWFHLRRCKVIGGWLVCSEASGSPSVTFVPDPNYEWKL